MEETFYKDLLDNLFEGVYFLDLNRIITYWNKSAERITGFKAKQVIGKSCRDNILIHVTENGLQLCNENCPMQATMEDGKPREAEVYLRHSDGHRIPVIVRANPIRDSRGVIIGSVETFSASYALMRSRRQLLELQNSVLLDELTGIGNRRHTEGRLEAHMAEYKINNLSFGILFCDIDLFKHVNDVHGHNTGDQILRMVAKTLNKNIREIDSVGRWGGEEFIIIMQSVSQNDLFAIGEKLRNLVHQSHLDTPGGMVRVSVSIGGTLAQKGDAIETIVNRADKLMYQSKANGRDRVTIG